jgi:pimeloyl-ACP methyl ester carboxylesterase
MADLPPPSPAVVSPPPIEYRVQGNEAAGEVPIVLLNGGLMSSFAWEPVAQGLASDYRVVRFDLRGQLMSPIVPREGAEATSFQDLAAHARDVVEVIDRLGAKRAHVIGTSFGALVGLQLVLDHPDRVASLVAMTAGPYLTPAMNEGTRKLYGLADAAVAGGDGGALLDQMVPVTYSPEWIAANEATLKLRRAQVAALPKVWFAGAAAILRAIEHVDFRPRLSEIERPVVVIGAEKDLTFPIEHSRALQAAIPGARLIVVPGAPHGFVIEQPEKALAAIREALKIVAPPTPPVEIEHPVETQKP